MALSYKYWDDCVDPRDLEALWLDPDVSTEWLDVGETRGRKVHLSRDPDGEPYLTQIEMKAVAAIVVSRHFDSQIDLEMICAISEIESDRQPLAERYDKKAKDTTLGIMQLLPKTADWLVRELGYQTYEVEGNPILLFRPFINVYLGAAYLKWLSNYDGKERSEEFVVRAYKGGPKKAAHKSTLEYWKRYLSVKESLPFRKSLYDGPYPNDASGSGAPVSVIKGSVLSLVADIGLIAEISGANGKVYNPVFDACSTALLLFSIPDHMDIATSVNHTFWDSRASPEDMDEMWNHPDVLKEWSKCGEIRGKVLFSHDKEKRPYLSRVEVKAVAEIILSKHFSTRQVKPTILCALAEIVSMRFVNGVGARTGIMGIDYPTAMWLYRDLGYKAYRVEAVDDLTKPFVSMYFGAAYLAWLSEYEGRQRTPQFIVQAYLAGPKNVNLQETGHHWLNFEKAVTYYEPKKKEDGGCSIL